MKKQIQLPLTEEVTASLQTGELVCLNGTLYSARDAAHKRLYEMIGNGEPLPFSLEGNVIYYLGPTPARPGNVIGSAGPTTSSRMDKYTPTLLDRGLKGMIGKGRRSQEVKESIVKNKAVYFVATGGAGALLSKCIIQSRVIAFEDLGTEAVREMTVQDFPVIVEIDASGNDLYEQVMAKQI